MPGKHARRGSHLRVDESEIRLKIVRSVRRNEDLSGP